MSEVIVYITNTGSETFVDQFDGKKIEFAPNTDVPVTESLARHLFGWKQKDRTAQLARLGWSYTANDVETSLAKLDKFVIREAPKSAQPKNAKENLIYVTNNGNEFSDRYDGRDYMFPSGECVAVPEAVAVHLFGFGLLDRTNQCHRLGLDPNNSDKFFGRFVVARTPPQKKRAA